MFRSRRTSDRVFNLFRNLFLLAILVFVLFPLMWAVLTSVKPEADIVTANLQYIPQRVTLENYVAIWTRSNYPTLVRNSFVSTTTTLVLTLTLGSLAAYAISRYLFRGRTGLLLFFLILRMFPAVLLLIPLFILMKNLRLLDSSIGLGLAYTAFLLPVAVWMMKGFFDAIPPDLEDAARIDGCTRLEALYRVVLPLARGGLIATAVFIGIAAWNDYLLALLLTTGQGSRTWPVGLQLMVGEFQLPWGALSAGGIISILPVIVLFALVQRTLIRGITAGAVKG